MPPRESQSHYPIFATLSPSQIEAIAKLPNSISNEKIIFPLQNKKEELEGCIKSIASWTNKDIDKENCNSILAQIKHLKEEILEGISKLEVGNFSFSKTVDSLISAYDFIKKYPEASDEDYSKFILALIGFLKKEPNTVQLYSYSKGVIELKHCMGLILSWEPEDIEKEYCNNVLAKLELSRNKIIKHSTPDQRKEEGIVWYLKAVDRVLSGFDFISKHSEVSEELYSKFILALINKIKNKLDATRVYTYVKSEIRSQIKKRGYTTITDNYLSAEPVLKKSKGFFDKYKYHPEVLESIKLTPVDPIPSENKDSVKPEAESEAMLAPSSREESSPSENKDLVKPEAEPEAMVLLSSREESSPPENKTSEKPEATPEPEVMLAPSSREESSPSENKDLVKPKLEAEPEAKLPLSSREESSPPDNKTSVKPENSFSLQGIPSGVRSYAEVVASGPREAPILKKPAPSTSIKFVRKPKAIVNSKTQIEPEILEPASSVELFPSEVETLINLQDSSYATMVEPEVIEPAPSVEFPSEDETPINSQYPLSNSTVPPTLVESQGSQTEPKVRELPVLSNPPQIESTAQILPLPAAISLEAKYPMPLGQNISKEPRTSNPSSALQAPSPHVCEEGKKEVVLCDKKKFETKNRELLQLLNAGNQKIVDKAKYLRDAFKLLDEYAKEFPTSFPKEAGLIRKQIEIMSKQFPKDTGLLGDIAFSTLQLLLNPNEEKAKNYAQLGKGLVEAKPHSNLAESLYGLMLALGTAIMAVGIGLLTPIGIGVGIAGFALASAGAVSFFHGRSKNALHQNNSKVIQVEMHKMSGNLLTP